MNSIEIKILALVLTLWSIVWKIYAAWIAAKHNHKKWFVILLILNTAGILEIVYIFYVAKKKWLEVKQDFKQAWKSIG